MWGAQKPGREGGNTWERHHVYFLTNGSKWWAGVISGRDRLQWILLVILLYRKCQAKFEEILWKLALKMKNKKFPLSELMQLNKLSILCVCNSIYKHTISRKRNNLNFAAIAYFFTRIKRPSALIVGSLRQPLKQINSGKMVTMLPAGRVLEQLLELSHIPAVPAGLRFPWMGMNTFEPLPPGSMWF